jgi:hypothetical protein
MRAGRADGRSRLGAAHHADDSESVGVHRGEAQPDVAAAEQDQPRPSEAARE